MSKNIEIKNLIYSVKTKNIIDNINLKISMSGTTLINGHNGAGKSTLLNLLAGFIKPTSGSIISRYINTEQPIGFVFQKSVLLNRTVRQNLLHSLKASNQDLSKNLLEDTIDKSLEEQDILHLSETLAGNLSVGEQQLVSIIRAYIIKPKIIFLDEPTSNLDPVFHSKTINLLRELSHETKIIIVSQCSSHELEFKDQIITLKNGKII